MPVVPFTETVDALIIKRDDGMLFIRGCDIWGNCGYYGGWYYWGRWILAGVLIFIFFLCMALIFTNSRKRVRTGGTPIYGTAWLVLPTYQQSQHAYGVDGGAPPPLYQPPAQGSTTMPSNGMPIHQTYGQPPPPMDSGYIGPPANPPPAGSSSNYNANNEFYAPPTNPPQAYVKN
ncbi:uncharacterized protein SAPINGB_P000976 [Magnusiomyces paraingens]|uniref:Protein RCR2 n=1 Tax=Magnusiomyces paraingens TaxID=2606893 RepID=A0A5E8B9J3_9ASCO|nr:uncharacterized protein SAPINGB_P000976 [Saprochaete ingens]VVT45958.1 unnamed protein product [Saprochaete ingens]